MKRTRKSKPPFPAGLMGCAFRHWTRLTNSQLLDEAIAAKLNVTTFNATAGPKYPFVGRSKDVDDGYQCGSMAEKWVRKVRWPFCWEA